MPNNRKLDWLKRILAVKVAVTLLAWGLPALLAPMSLLGLLGVPTPGDPLFLRLFGAVVTAFGIAYWYACKDPVRNVAILRVGILDNGLGTIVILVLTAFDDLRSAFMWASALLTFLFCVSFIVLLPRAERV